ncbi:RNA polymerase sigma factor ShbA [Haloechinothrix salitolerans]|uniref:RNA polymerase sigma factor ShbA n=1 Tax=Haloechinothrix salitolerans TaxID=926830 RepID=A0ABW2BXA0_9PSEU
MGDGLLADAAAGDRHAVNRLLAHLQPAVIRYCRGRLAITTARHSADDVAQEVLLAVFAALPRFQGNADGFLAFVYGIARHKVADAHRANGRDKSAPVEELPDTTDNELGPDEHVVRNELRSGIHHYLELLTDNQREVLQLRVLVGLSSEEVAHVMETTSSAVRVAQHRALKTLRRLIDADGNTLA